MNSDSPPASTNGGIMSLREGLPPSMADGRAPLLLRTKLHRPAVGNDYVPRPRLLERLIRNPNRALTLVAAPAGFGKTTLVAAWLETSERPSAWLSIDQNDDSLPVFLSYIVAAIRSIFPDALALTDVLLRSSHVAPAEVFTVTFINEVVQLPRDFILALDDYHFIRDEAIHQFMIRLIRQRPRRLHLVIITRVDPPFPLSSLRTSPLQTLEIRLRDLRFSSEEMRAFVTSAAGEEEHQLATADTLAVLQERTDGWAAGLRLAMLSLQGHPDPQTFLAEFRGTSDYVMDYLMDQVISQQPAQIVLPLLCSSILDRFCAPLCDAVLAGVPGVIPGAFMDWIERANLFVTPLDDRREWRRYDHLFRELLLSRLQTQFAPAEIAALHSRASDWFCANGLVDEAIHHALAANDPTRAAQAVEQHVPTSLAREDRVTLERWLRSLPDNIKQKRPALMVAGAWLQHFQGDTPAIDTLLADVESAIAGNESGLSGDVLRWVQGSVSALWSEYWFSRNGLQRAIEHSHQALDVLPPAGVYERRTAAAYWCFAKQALGEVEEAERFVADEVVRAESQDRVHTAQLYLILCWIRLIAGDLQQLNKLARHLLKESQRGTLPLSMTWAHYFLGLLHYEWNDLDTAAQHFTAIAERRYSAHFTAAQESMLGLALIRQAQGLAEEARETTEALAEFNLMRAGLITVKTRSAQARLAAVQGDIEAAQPWVRGFGLAVPDRPIPLFDEPSMTQARVLIAENSAESLRKATELLAGVHQLVLSTHNVRRLIEVFALQALALQGQGQSEAALDVLQEAVLLAQPGGFVRMFVDIGQPMHALLALLAKRGVAPNYLHRLLAAFALAETEREPGGAQDAAMGSQAQLLLTQRELEVLRMLDSPMTDKEIAARLFITVHTVKRHTGSIYQKLGVHSRRRAVARAKSLHIAPQMPLI
jgi:LuxR family transcriptional regulator, maltose regulon positive regulatory protein